MKKTILISCALLFIGCSESNKTETTTNEVTKSETVAVKSIQPAVEKAEAIAISTVPTIKSGADIYKACIACHGQNAEKAALGKSKIIKGWSTSKTINALNGYNNDSYGGAMKGLMKGQASILSKDDIKAVAEYISKL